MTPRDVLDRWERGTERFDAVRVALGIALGKRDWAALPVLAEETCQLILAAPDRVPLELGPVFVSVEEIIHALRPTADRKGVPATALLALLDLVHAFGSIGPLPEITEKIAASWIDELVAAPLDEGDRARVGFAALAIGYLVPAFAVAEVPRGTTAALESTTEFHDMQPRDMQRLLRHFIGATQRDPSKPQYKRGSYVLAHMEVVIDQLAKPFVQATSLLWMARIAYRVFMGKTAREVPTLAHAMIWEHVAEAEASAAARTNARQEEVSPVPDGETFDGGAYVVERVLRGTGMQKMCIGREVATGGTVLIAWDNCLARANVDELRAAVRPHAPGMFELAFAGRSDGSINHWGVVERVPEGAWLPSIVTAPDPRMAIELGLSAGALLAKAAEHGVVLAYVRPEYMWAEHTANGWQVTGLSARGQELFDRKGYDLVTHWVFDRHYHAPEWKDQDDRAVTFALASMIAAWAGPEIPAPLAELIARATRPDRAERPHLPAFLAELRDVAQAAFAVTPAR